MSKARKSQQKQISVDVKWDYLLVSTLILLGIIAYTTSFSGVFLLDDHPHITSNPYLLSERTFTEKVVGLFQLGRPVVNLSILVNHRVSGFQIFSYHLLNLLVHLGAGITLYLLICLVQQILSRPNIWLAFFAAALWLLHPIQTQAVTYIIQRAESLMGLCYLLTTYFSLKWFATLNRRWVSWALVSFFVGIGSKPILVTAPFVVLMFDRFLFPKTWHETLKRSLGLYLGFVVGLITLTLLVIFSPMDKNSGFSVEKLSVLDFLMSQFGAVLYYLRLILWPDSLALDYSWGLAGSLTEIVIPMIIVMGLIASGIYGFHKRKIWGFLILLYFILLAPSSSLIPIKDLMVIHRLYLPLAAVSILLVYGLHYLMSSKGVLNLILCLLIVTLCISTLVRNTTYHSESRMWEDVLRKRPNNPRAHNELGNAFLSEGRADEAYLHFQRAFEIEPDNPGPLMNLSNHHAYRGDLVGGEVFLQKALLIKPDYADAHYNIANIRLQQNRFEEAIGIYKKVIELKPDYSEAYTGQAVAYMNLNQIPKAWDLVKKALHLKPYSSWALATQGDLYLREGKAREALVCFQRAFAQNPRHPEIIRLLARTHEDLGQLPQALYYYSRGLEISPGRSDFVQKVQDLQAKLRERPN